MFELFYGTQLAEKRPDRIHDNGTRFAPSNRDRVYYCDICLGPHGYSGQRPTHWGNCMRKTWIKLGGPALEYGYENRYIDVTWHCAECEMKIRGLQGAESYDAVAADMGIFSEVERRERSFKSRQHIFHKK